jgi:S-adenosylmethionine decarboxylase
MPAPLVDAPARPVSSAVPATFTHLVADLAGVPGASLRDPTLLGGLLVAAASAAGLAAHGAPAMRVRPDEGVSGLLLVESCHLALHTFPDEELLLLDVLTRATRDPRRAVDVFARRLEPRSLRADALARG